MAPPCFKRSFYILLLRQNLQQEDLVFWILSMTHFELNDIVLSRLSTIAAGYYKITDPIEDRGYIQGVLIMYLDGRIPMHSRPVGIFIHHALLFDHEYLEKVKLCEIKKLDFLAESLRNIVRDKLISDYEEALNEVLGVPKDIPKLSPTEKSPDGR